MWPIAAVLIFKCLNPEDVWEECRSNFESGNNLSTWFQTFAVFWFLYVFFWVFPRRLIVVCRRFGTLYLFQLHRLLTHSEPPTTCCPLPIGPATSRKPRPLYKYHVPCSPTILHTSYPAYEDGTYTVFRNVGKQQSDAGEIPKKYTQKSQYLSGTRNRAKNMCRNGKSQELFDCC